MAQKTTFVMQVQRAKSDYRFKGGEPLDLRKP
jgi:hypothetical protein